MPTPELLPGVTTADCPPRVLCDARSAIRKARRRALVRDAVLVVMIAAVDWLFLRWPEARMPFLGRHASMSLLAWTNVLLVADLWLMRALPKWWARRIAGTWCRAEREKFSEKRVRNE
jgi:hypothetical protein